MTDWMLTTLGTSILVKNRIGAIVVAGAAAIALVVCVAGPLEIGRTARRTQAQEACERVRSLNQGLSAGMRSMAANMREFEQKNRRLAVSWRSMGAAISEWHSSGDDIVLQIVAYSAARDERSAFEEEQFANQTDRDAADLDARIASRCGQ